MSFSRKRGRPRLHHPKKDTGTSELAARHAKGLTMEALDICLKRSLISEEEHAAGLHLRWLYSLRFGAPTICAYNHADLGGRNTNAYDENWKSCRESEYEQALQWLKSIQAHIIVTNVAIFNHFPRFLLPPRELGPLSRRVEASQEINKQELDKLKEGLMLLYTIFAKMRHRSKTRTAC